MKKDHFIEKNYGLTPLEKSQFFKFLTPLFYSLELHFIVLGHSKTHFPELFLLK